MMLSKYCALLIPLVFFSSNVFALATDKSSPILIEADQVDMAKKAGVSTYSGNVKLTQGSIKIQADSIVVFTKDKKLRRLIANGSPATFRQIPDLSSDEVQASAIRVEYSAITGLLLLQNTAKLEQGENHFSGSKIEYDTVNDVLSASSSGKDQQRVQAIIQPETLPK